LHDPFPELLFQLRRKRMLLQKQVADEARIDQSYIAGLERGKRDPPKRAVLDRICDGLEASADERMRLHEAASLSRLHKTLDQIESGYPHADLLRRLISAFPDFDAESREVVAGLFEVLRRNKQAPQGRPP
jgi:transcriptional regulator with XRE-family HTH domain